MKCSACQHENDAVAQFCEECGSKLTRALSLLSYRSSRSSGSNLEGSIFRSKRSYSLTRTCGACGRTFIVARPMLSLGIVATLAGEGKPALGN
ncbi:MAG: zinc ribbon domain-containing protein [Gammaproteobacteria bacterium]|nr:zinc ribbon domain-containing protein [Gammaproteobacteria bacterium]